MDLNELNTKYVKEINQEVTSQMWMDFEVGAYGGYELSIHGTIDPSSQHDFIVVNFKEVDFIATNIEWGTDTSKDVFEIVRKDDPDFLKLGAIVNPNYTIFRFISNDNTKMYIVAKEVGYEKDDKALRAPKKS